MKALTEDEALEALYNGIAPSKLYAPNVEYNEQAKKLGLELLPEQPIFTKDWLMPDEYKNIDLAEFFGKLNLTETEQLRVAQEISLFMETNSENLLRYLIYLGDVIDRGNVVTGVGRGSSVSLYTLYLIGIHKVDSLKYDLSPTEFFKNEQK